MIIKEPVLLQIAITKEEKRQFKKLCFQADTTMSREVRKFIRGFIDNPPVTDRLYVRRADWEDS